MGNATTNKSPAGKVSEKWSIGKKLGKGSFGTVRECTRKKEPTKVLHIGFKAAVKIIEKKNLGPNELKNLNRESTILALADHPNCVHLYEIYNTSRRLYLVQEFCEGGELFDAITSCKEGAFSEKKAASVVKQVAAALDYLHAQKISHRDLKPENILYLDKEQTIIKLMDFGLARILDSDDVTIMTRCGTLHYVAPEVLSRQQGYNSKCDMWSLGVVLYVLLCGYLPFYQEDRNYTAKLIRLGKYEYDPEEWEEISDEAKDLIDNLINLDMNKRFTAKQVLEHPWIKPKKPNPKMARVFSRGHSERFEKLNEIRKQDNTAILAAMTLTSMQLRRWHRKAAEKVGQPIPVDENPEIEVHE